MKKVPVKLFKRIMGLMWSTIYLVNDFRRVTHSESGGGCDGGGGGGGTARRRRRLDRASRPALTYRARLSSFFISTCIFNTTINHSEPSSRRTE